MTRLEIDSLASPPNPPQVALESANESFHAKAGRLRLLHALEKLQGNALFAKLQAKLDQLQATERGFQRIRELTGLTDVGGLVCSRYGETTLINVGGGGGLLRAPRSSMRIFRIRNW